MKTYSYPNHPLLIIPQTFIVIRHAESVANPLDDDGVARHNLPSHRFGLSDKGKAQAAMISKKLKTLPTDRNWYDLVLTSTQKRSIDTCRAALGDGCRTNILSDSRVNEKDEGIRHKLTEQNILRDFPWAMYLFKKFGRYHHIPIHGESVPQVEERIRSLMRDLIQGKKINVLCFGHSAWMRILHFMISKGSTEIYEDKEGLPYPKNGSVYIFTRNRDETRLVIHDDHITE